LFSFFLFVLLLLPLDSPFSIALSVFSGFSIVDCPFGIL
jgi:hypothetical protein